MPRFPGTSPAVRDVYKSIFARVAQRLAGIRGEVYPLHIGDTYLDPLSWLSGELIGAESSPELARYAHPDGRTDLVERICERLSEEGFPAGAEEIQITCGATHGLFSAAAALLAPGDEVLVLAPYWPLIPGILRTTGAVPIEVPFFDRVAAGAAADFESLVGPYLGERTAALYFNSPNNPSGQVLSRAQLEALAAFARKHDLWVLADEVYAGFVFGEKPPLVAALPGMKERTLSAFSFSKGYAMAGYRVGYLVGPAAIVEVVRKISTHTVYSVSGIGQLLAARVLARGPALRDAIRDSYRACAEITARTLRARFHAAQGGAYVFLDLRHTGDPAAVLARALDRGVALAPGEAFGPSYRGWARLCYTAVPPARLEGGLRLLNEVLAEVSP
jgi:aspartate/methionine/tyrosine aminotransferase